MGCANDEVAIRSLAQVTRTKSYGFKRLSRQMPGELSRSRSAAVLECTSSLFECLFVNLLVSSGVDGVRCSPDQTIRRYERRYFDNVEYLQVRLGLGLGWISPVSNTPRVQIGLMT